MRRTVGTVAAAAVLLLPAIAPAAEKGGDTPDDSAKTAEDVTLEGGAEGTVFGTLTVTGEDRISIEFERPDLALDLDPREAPGLEWGDPLAVLQRSGVDLNTPYLNTTAGLPAHGLADDWAAVFREGPVARFQPNLEDVSRWALTIVDSQSDTVAVFQGKGDPPDEIAWTGRRRDGEPAVPGLTYSYVMEATDKAGNRRTFPGSGFELPPYRLAGKDRLMHLFAGRSLPTGWAQRPTDPPPAVLLEVASRLNRDHVDAPIEVRASARSFAEATQLADAVGGALRERLLGDPSRVRTVTDVRPNAPEGGALAVEALPADHKS